MTRTAFVMVYSAAVAAFFITVYRLELDRGGGLVAVAVSMLSFPGNLLGRLSSEHSRFLSAVFNVCFYSGVAVVAHVFADAIDRRRASIR